MAKTFLSPRQQDALTDRSISLVTGVGRLRPQVSFTQVQAEMKNCGGALDGESPDANLGKTLVVLHLIEAAYGPELQGFVCG
jgi:hypothetical protein